MQIKKIIHSCRKTIMLQVCDDATLIVKAPLGVGNNIIEKMVLKHSKWWEKKKKEVLSRDIKFTQKKFANGEIFYYLGQLYQLKIIQTEKLTNPLTLHGKYFYLRKGIANPREIFIAWYKQAALEVICQRVVCKSKKKGFKYSQIKISSAQKRWASCSQQGNLNFSWRLVMAPLQVIDYVIIHELVHLIEKNHSRTFWNKVRMLMPEYKKQQNWLKEKGYLLSL